MLCPKCGGEIPNDSQYCYKCGEIFVDSQNEKKKCNRNKKYIILGAVLSAAIVLIAIGTIFGIKNSSKIYDEEQVYSCVCEEIQSEENSYIENGYVPLGKVNDAIEDVLKYAQKQRKIGNITYYEKGELCVYMKLSDGTSLIYLPKTQDTKAGGDKLFVVTLQPFYSEFESSVEEKFDLAAKNITSKNKNYSFDKKDNIDNEDFTIEKAKDLAPYSVIIWDGHGGYSKSTHSFLSLNIDYSKVKKQNKTDCDAQRIISSTDGNVLLTADFFDYYYKDNSLADSLIYLGTCSSGTDDYLANTLISKGAKVVFANSNTTNTTYDSQMAESIFSSLSNGKTATDALKYAKEKNGDVCKDYFNLFGSTNEVLLFGNKKTILKPQEIKFKDTKIGKKLLETKWMNYTSSLDSWGEATPYYNFTGSGIMTDTTTDYMGDEIRKAKLVSYSDSTAIFKYAKDDEENPNKQMKFSIIKDSKFLKYETKNANGDSFEGVICDSLNNSETNEKNVINALKCNWNGAKHVGTLNSSTAGIVSFSVKAEDNFSYISGIMSVDGMDLEFSGSHYINESHFYLYDDSGNTIIVEYVNENTLNAFMNDTNGNLIKETWIKA